MSSQRHANIYVGSLFFGIAMIILGFIISFNSSYIAAIVFLSLGVFSFILFVILNFVEVPESKKEKEAREAMLDDWKQEHERKKIIYNKQLEKYVNSFGKVSKEIFFYDSERIDIIDPEITDRVFIFEDKSIIILNGKPINFKDIIAFKLTDDEHIIYQNSETTFKTSTSTGSIIGRAIIGGVLLGGVGAIIGGATAKKNTTTISTPQNSIVYHDYKIYITINSLTDPQIVLELDYHENAINEIVSVLSIILDRNKKNKSLNKSTI